MRVLDRFEAASQNLFQTYVELGRATPGAHLWVEEGFTACSGAFEHPICNFAADLKLDRSTVARLRLLAQAHPSFCVYFADSENGTRGANLLAEDGFRLAYQLVQMVAEPGGIGDEAPLHEATTAAERIHTATFMVDQFFKRQAPVFRRRVAEATARALDLRLLTLREHNHIQAAVMLCESGGTLGIYNLCVAQSLRGMGIGKNIVRTVLNMARCEGSLVTLQCDLSLVPWYRDQGFRIVGSVDVYTLPMFPVIDIMG
jgi:ribosomal protein S18 acetylase RimI-like enzyme